MKALFFNMLNASFYGSVVILAVLLLRLVLKKAPRAAICLLWVLAGIRLVLPFTIESSLSLQPAAEDIAQIRQEVVADDPNKELLPTVSPDQTQDIHIPAIPQQPAELPEDVQIVVSDDAVSEVVVTEKPERVVDHGAVAAWIWAAGIAGLLAYSTWSYWRLRRWVRAAVRQGDGSWECAGLDTAFVLGLFRPRIYLPGGLSDRDRELILAHERAHIARKDHWIKPIGYLILMLHWFNPLVWLAYVCLCRDIEMACDERVVKTMDVAARKDYSLALINCSSRGIGIAACPVAFGEVGVKQRILGVLHYRKPGFWIVVAAVVAVVFVTVCLMTDPASVNDQGEELPQLEQCREALAAFQADETWYISVQTVSAYDGPRMEYQSEMWGDGEDRLCKLSSQQINDGSSHCWLVKDGRCYTRDLGNRGDMDLSYDTGWYQVDAFSEQETEVWQRELDWNSANITWRSTQETEGGVTVICGTDLCMDFLEGQGEVADSRLEFRLDADGNLVSIGWTLEYTDGGIFSQTSTISWDSDAAIRAAIEAEAAETLRPEYTYYLEQCRVVLEGFQKLDSYHVVQQDFYGGSILNSSTVTNYWRSGDDWCHIAQNRDVDNGRIFQRLKKNGVEYQQELYDTLTDNPQGRPWSVVDVPSDCMDGNWLEVFSWKDSMVEHVITNAAGDDGTVVKMTVKEDPSAFGKYCPYEVRFWFESDGSLQSVELILEENEGKENWYIINSIYNIDHIENADAHIDAVYEDVCVALNCTDPNCTDVTHGHYGIACTVEHCDDPAHGHGGHDHH